MTTRIIRMAVALALGVTGMGVGVANATYTGPGVLTKHVLFDTGSSDVKMSIADRIDGAIAALPADPGTVHLTVTTSAPVGVLQSAPALWVQRVNAVVNRVTAALKVKGIPVVVETTIWHQPGLQTSNPKALRVVYFDMNW